MSKKQGNPPPPAGRDDRPAPPPGPPAHRSPGCSTAYAEDVIQRLRGQLQNCVNHLERAKRKGYGGNFDEAIESANRALYETVGR